MSKCRTPNEPLPREKHEERQTGDNDTTPLDPSQGRSTERDTGKTVETSANRSAQNKRKQHSTETQPLRPMRLGHGPSTRAARGKTTQPPPPASAGSTELRQLPLVTQPTPPNVDRERVFRPLPSFLPRGPGTSVPAPTQLPNARVHQSPLKISSHYPLTSYNTTVPLH